MQSLTELALAAAEAAEDTAGAGVSAASTAAQQQGTAAAEQGTQQLMIHKHYSHIIARMRSQQLAGPQHGEYDDLDGDD